MAKGLWSNSRTQFRYTREGTRLGAWLQWCQGGILGGRGDTNICALHPVSLNHPCMKHRNSFWGYSPPCCFKTQWQPQAHLGKSAINFLCVTFALSSSCRCLGQKKTGIFWSSIGVRRSWGNSGGTKAFICDLLGTELLPEFWLEHKLHRDSGGELA